MYLYSVAQIELRYCTYCIVTTVAVPQDAVPALRRVQVELCEWAVAVMHWPSPLLTDCDLAMQFRQTLTCEYFRVQARRPTLSLGIQPFSSTLVVSPAQCGPSNFVLSTPASGVFSAPMHPDLAVWAPPHSSFAKIFQHRNWTVPPPRKRRET